MDDLAEPGARSVLLWPGAKMVRSRRCVMPLARTANTPAACRQEAADEHRRPPASCRGSRRKDSPSGAAAGPASCRRAVFPSSPPDGEEQRPATAVVPHEAARDPVRADRTADRSSRHRRGPSAAARARPRERCTPQRSLSGARQPQRRVHALMTRRVHAASPARGRRRRRPPRHQVHDAADRRHAVERGRDALDHFDLAEVHRRDLQQADRRRTGRRRAAGHRPGSAYTGRAVPGCGRWRRRCDGDVVCTRSPFVSLSSIETSPGVIMIFSCTSSSGTTSTRSGSSSMRRSDRVAETMMVSSISDWGCISTATRVCSPGLTSTDAAAAS